MTINAITFDFWATLYKTKTIDYHQRLLQVKESVEEGSGQSFATERFQDAVTVARESWSQAWFEEYRTITAGEWLDILLKNLPAKLPASHFKKIQATLENSVLHDPPILAPDAKAILPTLAKDYKLAVISDTGLTPGRVLREVLSADGIIEYFSYLTFSDEVGRSKPHAQPFLTTLKELGVSAQETVHVGDLLRTDIVGAKQVGMRAVQYTGINHDKETPSTNISPDGVIKNHADLKPLLHHWAALR